MANEQTKPSDQPEMADLDINATDATTNEADVVNNEPSTENEVSEEAALIADLEKQLVAAQEEAASLKDQMLRAAADVQNARRRALSSELPVETNSVDVVLLREGLWMIFGF